MKKLNVGILIFENVEVLDFAGPFEVFSRTRLTPGAASRRSEKSAPFNISLSIVEKEFGRKVADETARYIEYPRISVDAT